MGPFVLDSNFFIQAHRLLYPLDVVVSFWDKVADLANRGVIISIDKVRDEIYGDEDDLENWCRANLPNDFFKQTGTTEVLNSYQAAIGWAVSRNQYLPRALTEFLDDREADAWLIAFAHANALPVVTYEISEPNSQRKVKIPDVCIGLNVTYLNTIEMLRALGESF